MNPCPVQVLKVILGTTSKNSVEGGAATFLKCLNPKIMFKENAGFNPHQRQAEGQRTMRHRHLTDNVGFSPPSTHHPRSGTKALPAPRAVARPVSTPAAESHS